MKRSTQYLLTLIGSTVVVGTAWAGISSLSGPDATTIDGGPPVEMIRNIDAVDAGWRPAKGTRVDTGLRAQLHAGTLHAWFYTAANGRAMAAVTQPRSSAVGACDEASPELRLCNITVDGTTFVMLGRSAPEVHQLTAQYADGRVVQASMVDGAWVLDLPVPGDALRTPTMFVELVARAADGSEIARSATDRLTAHARRALNGARQMALINREQYRQGG